MEQRVSIPMAADMESLNVLSAATLILYEAARHLLRG
jgi:tRNA G18 (ribose-2'-O)-methylase SpoU